MWDNQCWIWLCYINLCLFFECQDNLYTIADVNDAYILSAIILYNIVIKYLYTILLLHLPSNFWISLSNSLRTTHCTNSSAAAAPITDENSCSRLTTHNKFEFSRHSLSPFPHSKSPSYNTHAQRLSLLALIICFFPPRRPITVRASARALQSCPDLQPRWWASKYPRVGVYTLKQPLGASTAADTAPGSSKGSYKDIVGEIDSFIVRLITETPRPRWIPSSERPGGRARRLPHPEEMRRHVDEASSSAVCCCCCCCCYCSDERLLLRKLRCNNKTPGARLLEENLEAFWRAAPPPTEAAVSLAYTTESPNLAWLEGGDTAEVFIVVMPTGYREWSMLWACNSSKF